MVLGKITIVLTWIVDLVLQYSRDSNSIPYWISQHTYLCGHVHCMWEQYSHNKINKPTHSFYPVIPSHNNISQINSILYHSKSFYIILLTAVCLRIVVSHEFLLSSKIKKLALLSMYTMMQYQRGDVKLYNKANLQVITVYYWMCIVS